MTSAVILKKDVRLDVASIAPAFASMLDLTVQDARLLIRKVRGICVEHQEDARARAISQALEKIGIENEIIPQAEIPKAPIVRRVFNGSVDASGFQLICHPLRPAEKIGWENIHYVSIGVIATPKYEDLVTSRGFGKLSPLWSELPHRALPLSGDEEAAVKRRVQRKPKLDKSDLRSLYRDHTEAYADLWTYGASHRYRISRRDFNYSSLGEQAGRLSLENFRLLVSEMFARLPRTLFTRMSREYAVGAELYEIIFDNIEEFDRYSRWFLHQAAGPSPKPGVLMPGAGEQLLGPVAVPLDDVEALE
jgi:hypothetical protein